MMHIIADALDASALQALRAQLAQARWHDGRETAGHLAAPQKRNQQLRADDAHALAAGRIVTQALSAHAGFVACALPARVLAPMFNRYRDGGEYGLHIDNAIRVDPLSGQALRADVSTTVFLSDPHEYEGGELVVHDSYGTHSVKLPAGQAVVYPGGSLHRVNPVTRGQRLAAFFWTQSMVADDTRRALLWELDGCVQRLSGRAGNEAEVARLGGLYHNLLRQWAQL